MTILQATTMEKQVATAGYNVANLTVGGKVVCGLWRRGGWHYAQVVGDRNKREGHEHLYATGEVLLTEAAWCMLYNVVTEADLISDLWVYDNDAGGTDMQVTLDANAVLQWMAGQVAAPAYDELDEGPMLGEWEVM